MANVMVSFNFTPDLPWLPWQRNLGQNWLSLGLCKRYLREGEGEGKGKVEGR